MNQIENKWQNGILKSNYNNNYININRIRNANEKSEIVRLAKISRPIYMPFIRKKLKINKPIGQP